ncbi:primosomal protein N', partial [Candidatus Babeliales bacterium]|nr:primosomal protein N' [Candidatus Babeliales bacterium]
FSFHSATQTCEKRLLWKSLIEKQPCLILGVHLPILLPIANLGLIIVDEEHEGGFKEKSHPRLNSKEVAVWRAKHYQIPIVLGSATPSVSSLVRVDAGHWQRCRLQKRFAGTFPEVEVVSLREKKRRPEFWLTQQLKAAIQSRLEKKEQTIVFINRRGHSFFTQCKTCGEIFECKNCSVSLTLHKKFDCEGLLRCHYCGYASRIPQACSQCGAPAKEFLFKGIGTQRMVAILQKEFPEARIKRADLDTASKKRAWQETVDAFYKGEIDILVGTQTLTKGYHFPNVTLVGIVWGDLDLNFPSYDARESALQQLIQVAGRCGRADGKKSEVIIQTLSEDAIFKCVSEQKYEEFCKKEFAARKMCNYPPFARLIRIELRHKDGVVLAREAKTLTEALRRENSELDAGISILGPAKPPVHRVRGVEALHILLKANSFDSLHKVIGGVDLELFKALIVFEVLL